MNYLPTTASEDTVKLNLLNAVDFEARGKNGQLLTLTIILCLLVVTLVAIRNI